MELISLFTTYVMTGFVGSASGATVLGAGGYMLHRKYVVKHKLIRYLINVTEKKFSTRSLVSFENKGNGVSKFKLKVPEGYSVDDMLKLKPAIEDKFDCEIQVWSEETNFVIEMATNPIPYRLNFEPHKVNEILQEYECAVYLGESRFGHMLLDFTANSTPHLIFSAPTGGGKSNLVNQAICGMLQRYDPSELILHLVDLKFGVELYPYRNVTHVQGFYETPDEAYEGLQTILLEIQRRNNLFKRHGVKKLAEYNEITSEKLPRIVIIADEFAQFSNIADKDFKAEVYTKWEEVLQLGRSTGIHVFIGTQVADANVFPRQIKGNIDARFGFKYTDEQHSKMVTGGSELLALPNIEGRGLYKLGTKMIQTQTPYISPDQMRQIIEQNNRKKVEVPQSNLKKVEVQQPTERIVPIEEIRFIPVENEPKKSLPINRETSQPSIDDLFMSEESFLKQVSS